MKRTLALFMTFMLLVSLPAVFAQEDDPEGFQGQFFSAEPPQGWFGQNWFIDEEPSGEFAIFTPTEVDYSGFDPSHSEIEELGQISELVDAVREGGALGVIIYNGDMLAELGGDAALLMGELTSQLGIEGAAQGVVEGRGVTGTSIQGTIPGSGALAGETFGFYGAILSGQSITVLLAGGAPEAVFADVLPEFEHFAQTMEGIADGEALPLEAPSSGFISVDTPSFTIDVPESWTSSYRVLEEDGNGVTLLSPAEVSLTDEDILYALARMDTTEAFLEAVSADILIGIVEFEREDIGDCTELADCAIVSVASLSEIAGDSLIEFSELVPANIGGADGVEMTATLAKGETTYSLLAILVEYQDKAYLVAVGGPQEQFTAQEATIQQVFESLTFK
jgi:hypothetical protein